MRNDSARFAGRQYHWHLGRPCDALDIVDEIELSFEHLLIKKQQRAESLILSGGGDILFDCEISKEFCDFFLAHFARVAFAMEENITANPIDVRLFGPDRVMLHSQMPANAIK